MVQLCGAITYQTRKNALVVGRRVRLQTWQVKEDGSIVVKACGWWPAVGNERHIFFLGNSILHGAVYFDYTHLRPIVSEGTYRIAQAFAEGGT